MEKCLKKIFLREETDNYLIFSSSVAFCVGCEELLEEGVLLLGETKMPRFVLLVSTTCHFYNHCLDEYKVLLDADDKI